jgi:hypothetical protein
VVVIAEGDAEREFESASPGTKSHTTHLQI